MKTRPDEFSTRSLVRRVSGWAAEAGRRVRAAVGVLLRGVRVSEEPSRPAAVPSSSCFEALRSRSLRMIEGKGYTLDEVARAWAREIADVRYEWRVRMVRRNPVVRFAAKPFGPGSYIDEDGLAFALAVCRYADVDPAEVGLGENGLRRRLEYLELAQREEYCVYEKGPGHRALHELLENYGHRAGRTKEKPPR